MTAAVFNTFSCGVSSTPTNARAEARKSSAATNLLQWTRDVI